MTHNTKLNNNIQGFLNQEFNFVNKKVLETCRNNFENFIVKPSFHLLASKWLDNNLDIQKEVKKFFTSLDLKEHSQELGYSLQDYLGDNYNDEIMYFYQKQKHKPINSDFLEIRDTDFELWALNHSDELFDIGIGVIESNRLFKTMLFISNAGLNFNNSHWLQLCQLRNLLTGGYNT